MAIQLHPDAAKRYDELGNDLLTRVVPKPQFEPTPQQRLVDFHPVVNLSPNDIVGEIRVTKSVINGAGEEIGRIFQHSGREMALIGEGYEALSTLAERLQSTATVREAASMEFIRDAVFDWVTRCYGNSTPESLSALVLQKIEEAIKDYEIWIPIHSLRLEVSISLGDVVFRTITGAMMEHWQNSIKTAHSNDADAAVALARLRSQLQGFTAATVKARAEKKRAVELARDKAEQATALLRFFSHVNLSPRLRSYCTPLGRENIVLTAELYVEDGRIVSYDRGVLDNTDTTWFLSNAWLAQYPGVLDQLKALSAKEDRTPFQRTLYDALQIYARSSLSQNPADKLIYILVPLESLLLRNDMEPIQKNIAERMAFLVGNSLEKRKAVVANVIETYQLRSSFIHHAESINDLETLSSFMIYAWTCIYNLLFLQERFRDKDELIGALEDQKLS